MSFVATAIGAGVALTTTAISAGLGARNRKKAEEAQKELLAIEQKNNLQLGYLSLWGAQEQSRGGLAQSGYSLLTAKTNQQTGLIIGISIFSIIALIFIGYMVNKIIRI